MRKDVNAQPPIEIENLKIRKPKRVAAGIQGVTKSFKIGFAEAGISRTIKTMRTVNKFDGYDCPGCAWPDPDDHRSGFEFCENGAKAGADEATLKRASETFFRQHSIDELKQKSDKWLNDQGLEYQFHNYNTFISHSLHTTIHNHHTVNA